MVIKMNLYLDLIFLLNIWFDFLLLLSVAWLLKRNIKIKRIFIGSLIGGVTIFILFINLGEIELFFFKIIVSILMIIATFSYKNLKYTLTNLGYFYLCSIILGGGMYLLNDSFAYSSNGLLLYKNGMNLNYFILLLLSPLILIFYLKQTKKLKENYSNYHKVDVVLNKKIYHLNGYLDTGNNLYDPYKKRGVILVNLKLDYDNLKVIYTPFESLNHKGLVKCLKPDKLYIDKKEFSNYLIGLSDDKFQIEGINCILHNKMKGDLK